MGGELSVWERKINPQKIWISRVVSERNKKKRISGVVSERKKTMDIGSGL